MSNPLAAFEGLSHLIQNGKIDWEAVRSLPVAAEAATSSPFSNWTVTYENGALSMSCEVQMDMIVAPMALLAGTDGTVYCLGMSVAIAPSLVPNYIQIQTSTSLFDPAVQGTSVESLIFVGSFPRVWNYQLQTFTV
jgi:hypothetical protein